jgi:hypothetical protein
MRSRSLVVFGAALVGATMGWLAVQRHIGRHRADLFSPRPLRRLSALAHLAGQGGTDTVRLLRDYLAWEREPMLRRRAGHIARHLEATLG